MTDSYIGKKSWIKKTISFFYDIQKNIFFFINMNDGKWNNIQRWKCFRWVFYLVRIKTLKFVHLIFIGVRESEMIFRSGRTPLGDGLITDYSNVRSRYPFYLILSFTGRLLSISLNTFYGSYVEIWNCIFLSCHCLLRIK